MIKAGIIGATGYAGNEIVRLLLGHKDVEVAWYGSRSYIDQKYADVYQNFFKLVDAKCMDDNMEALADEVDVIFTATPQGLCASLINEGILSKAKVIDLSADFRIKDVKKYEKWYGIEHKAPQFIDEAVYGLCEINREDIKKARLIANPGCYPTCSTLSIYPLIKEGLIDPSTIIIDAKSGTSGAGRGAKVANLFCEVNEKYNVCLPACFHNIRSEEFFPLCLNLFQLFRSLSNIRKHGIHIILLLRKQMFCIQCIISKKYIQKNGFMPLCV